MSVAVFHKKLSDNQRVDAIEQLHNHMRQIFILHIYKLNSFLIGLIIMIFHFVLCIFATEDLYNHIRMSSTTSFEAW